MKAESRRDLSHRRLLHFFQRPHPHRPIFPCCVFLTLTVLRLSSFILSPFFLWLPSENNNRRTKGAN